MRFKILEKEKWDKYDREALYLWDLVFSNDPEYQRQRKKLKVKPIKPRMTKRMEKIKERLEKGFEKEIWEELAQRCLECGQCTMVCPTCFCFRLDDWADGRRERSLDSCLFHDFSEVAGGHRFLDSTAKRLYFWYYHKFVRIPEQYGIPGCLECNRCSQACPAGIEIKKVLKKILE